MRVSSCKWSRSVKTMPAQGSVQERNLRRGKCGDDWLEEGSGMIWLVRLTTRG